MGVVFRCRILRSQHWLISVVSKNEPCTSSVRCPDVGFVHIVPNRWLNQLRVTALRNQFRHLVDQANSCGVGSSLLMMLTPKSYRWTPVADVLV